MRTIEYGTPTHVPAFLTKLWKLVTDVSCDELISWSPAGTSFIIFDEIRFSKELLPMYFKHNNMASFVRQLNMYGFRKLSCIDQGGMHCYRSEIEFYHQYFLKGQESLLELIKRKIPNSKSEEPKVKQEYIDELINNIKSLKGKQDSAEQGMRYLKRENKMLWRHISLLAEQYSKQQTVLQQLVPFFMNMVHHSNREIALKRKAPLMIDEGNGQPKLPRLSSPYYVEHSEQDQIASIPSPPGNVSNRGPVIHDVTEMESSKLFPANILCSPNTSSKDSEAIVDSPLSCSLESSEQNSPYTDSAVETLNILNHNFERSNSLSPHMEMKHSPASATSPLHHHPSQVRAMPSPGPSSSSYSVSSGISPVTIIDETTSDVPLSSTILTRPFVPKIEDTCTDSGMYTMDSMLNERTSMMPERTSIMPEQAASMMSERTASMLSEQRTSMLHEQAASLLSEQTSILPHRTSAVKSNSLLTERPSSSISENPSTSRNKCLPNFASSSKNNAPSVPWMLNQELEGTEANFASWLGQIFKSDNLVPGLSLPQDNETFLKTE